MGWLSGWSKRIEITISNTNIDGDSDPSHFPVPLFLGTSVGTGSDDVSCVFDELTSDDNRKKIAVTQSDGTTQLYVEIEDWDDANEKAVLWVSKSGWTISRSSATTIYLYYDSSQDDNADYVGDVGSRTEVWHTSTKGAYLCTNLLDSTSNDHNLTNNNSCSFGSDYGKQADGVDVDGSDKSLGITDSLDIDGDEITMMCWAKFPSEITSGTRCYMDQRNYTSDIAYFMGYEYNSGTPRIYADRARLHVSDDIISKNVYVGTGWHFVALRYDGTTLYGYHNSGTAYDSEAYSGDGSATGTSRFAIGNVVGSIYFDSSGSRDTVLVYGADMGAAWVKACYCAQDDNLVSWGSEETATSTAAQAIIIG